jgi:predicted RNA-binding Zn ribbon-like protein
MNDALLNAYQAVEALSADMLAAAQRADWPAFEQASQACTRQVEALRERTSHHASGLPWNAVQSAQKQAILLKILRHDAQIRRLRTGAMPPPAVCKPAHPALGDCGDYPMRPDGGLLH